LGSLFIRRQFLNSGGAKALDVPLSQDDRVSRQVYVNNSRTEGSPESIYLLLDPDGINYKMALVVFLLQLPCQRCSDPVAICSFVQQLASFLECTSFRRHVLKKLLNQLPCLEDTELELPY
jgi:hypothetical protein